MSRIALITTYHNKSSTTKNARHVVKTDWLEKVFTKSCVKAFSLCPEIFIPPMGTLEEDSKLFFGLRKDQSGAKNIFGVRVGEVVTNDSWTGNQTRQSKLPQVCKAMRAGLDSSSQ